MREKFSHVGDTRLMLDTYVRVQICLIHFTKANQADDLLCCPRSKGSAQKNIPYNVVLKLIFFFKEKKRENTSKGGLQSASVFCFQKLHVLVHCMYSLVIFFISICSTVAKC